MRSSTHDWLQDEDDLNSMLHDIELAVQRGRAHEEREGTISDESKDTVGLELKAKMVAASVSSVGGIGLLDQVKEYNALLEKVIAS